MRGNPIGNRPARLQEDLEALVKGLDGKIDQNSGANGTISTVAFPACHWI
jgi:hypothetical protein